MLLLTSRAALLKRPPQFIAFVQPNVFNSLLAPKKNDVGGTQRCVSTFGSSFASSRLLRVGTVVRTTQRAPSSSKISPATLSAPLRSKDETREAKSSAKAFDLLTRKDDEKWEKMFDKLRRFVEREGHCDVHVSNKELGPFVSRNRRMIKEGILSEDRRRRLRSLGFKEDPFEEAWDRMFGELEAYVREHGDALVPASYPPRPSLSKWVAMQRSYYQDLRENWRHEHPLTPRRLERLKAVGFVFDAVEHSWRDMFRRLEAFRAAHGHCLFGKGEGQDDLLVWWVERQRVLYRKNARGEPTQLSAQRVELLNRLGFEWDPREAIWTERYEELRALGPDASSSSMSTTLHNWINKQRMEYSRNQRGLTPRRLTERREERLNAIGFDWKYNPRKRNNQSEPQPQ